ncbi:peptidoglycan DD-metalloendopeptidase family protein [Zavarzinia compransoris]|uniref:peptidoglycan DD-metalloendopeptidase family protein n=1 Tax=Zavarzinia compransoris TaxID=1264899 RepID=UPI0010E8DCC3|nr:peptidoglycan DD-metalloendopeptidase family protein [Zavarzinia compransoris]TDP46835.1 murein DD-endopeptidase MepM/ murein hydrolase activator NlpD [Zavarzinia compransoris]
MPPATGPGNALLKTIVRHSIEDRPSRRAGRFLASVAVAALIGLGAGVGVASLFGTPGHGPQADLAAGTPLPLDAGADDNTLADADADTGDGEKLADDSADPTVEPPAPEDIAAGQAEHEVVSVEQGDTLMSILTEAGLDRTEAYEVVEILRPLFNPRDLRVGQELTIVLAPATAADDENLPRLAELAFDTDVDRRVRVTRGTDGQLSAAEERTELTVALTRVIGTIDDSLFASAGRAGLPPAVTAELIRMFSYDVDFQRDIQPGDHFELLVERHQDPDGRTLKWGDILYAKMILSGDDLPIYRHIPGDDKIPDFFNPKGESVRKALLRTPIDGARISSGFGMRRHPVLGYSKMHKGIDFAAPTGTPILAAGDGTVDKIGRAGSYGNYIRIRHDGRYSTAYAHLSRFAKGLKPGSRVRQGQTIGYVGTTGRSTGPHLHYEILAAGAQVNPQGVKFQSGRKLAGKELASFNARKREIDRLLAETPVQSAMAAPGPDKKPAP